MGLDERGELGLDRRGEWRGVVGRDLGEEQGREVDDIELGIGDAGLETGVSTLFFCFGGSTAIVLRLDAKLVGLLLAEAMDFTWTVVRRLVCEDIELLFDVDVAFAEEVGLMPEDFPKVSEPDTKLESTGLLTADCDVTEVDIDSIPEVFVFTALDDSKSFVRTVVTFEWLIFIVCSGN